MTAEYRHCRFCHRDDDARVLLKYGVRQYAHTRCFRDARGFDALLALPRGVLQTVTPMTLELDEGRKLMDLFRGVLA